jgi:hypothetical protein
MNLGGTFVGALFALTISVSNVTAQQQVITVCGASTGFGHYLEPKHDGWMKDGISKGTLTVMRDATGAYDIISKDTMTTFSARGDGAQVVKVNGSDDLRFTLVVVYPKPVTELYQFTLDRSGRGPELDFPREQPGVIARMVRLHLDTFGYAIGELAKLLHVHEKQLGELYDLSAAPAVAVKFRSQRDDRTVAVALIDLAESGP